MAKTILEEALEDAKTLKNTAIENAKNVLVEAMSPKIKQFVESQLGECMADGAMMNPDKEMKVVLQMPKKENEAAMYEEHDDEAEDVELMRDLGVLDSDEEDDSEDDKEDENEDGEDKEDMDEALELEAKDKDEESKEDEDKVEEVVSITNEDLREALSEIFSQIKSEAKVTKGFGDVQDATIKASGGAGAKGLADEKSGEHQFAEVMPTDAKDWTVKEAAYKKQIALLKKEGNEYKQAFSVLKNKLHEVNLFNSKLLYTQKILNLNELNNKQRLAIIEAFDRAESMREVELVYKSLSETFKIAGVVAESKQDRASKAKASRLSTPSSTVLKEALVKEEKEKSGSNDLAERMKKLAGILE